jgi:hypothetical protein
MDFSAGKTHNINKRERGPEQSKPDFSPFTTMESAIRSQPAEIGLN